MSDYSIKLKGMLKWGVLFSLLMVLPLLAREVVGIVPLGDSITHEDYRDSTVSDAIADENRSAYRDDLWQMLLGEGYSVDFLGSLETGSAVVPAFDYQHEGWNGLRDDQMAANVYDENNDSSYLKARANAGEDVDVILLHIGTNGLVTDNDPGDINATLEAIDAYEEDYNTHVTVVLARIINCWKEWDNTEAGVSDECDDDKSAHLTTYNDNVVTMAQERIAQGDDIVIVDMENGAGFEYNASDMVDDLHPNDTGYAKMATLWFEALKHILPLHQWHLDENASAVGFEGFIDWARDANGTCSQCPKKVDGLIGSAEDFNGSSSAINIVDDGTFDWEASDSFSIELWMQADRNDTLQVMIGRYASNSWWIGHEDNRVKVYLGGEIESNTTIDCSGTQWIQVVVVKDAPNTEIRLYINGELDTTDTISLEDYSGDEDVNIGWFYNGYYFDGRLDEITIYNGILSIDQIREHYQRATKEIAIAITSTPPSGVVEVDSAYSYDVKSNDLRATFSLTKKPDGDWMSIDSASGVISGTTPSYPKNDKVTVQATHGDSADQNFTVKTRDHSTMPEGMIHYWKLNEEESPYLDYFNGIDANCTKCSVQVSGGQANEAQEFDGDVELNAPNNSLFNWGSGDSFTVELWVKPESGGSTEVFLGRHQGGDGSASWWLGRKETKVKLEVGSKSLTSSVDIVTDGTTWTHVAMVKDIDADRLTLYINGEEDNSTTGIEESSSNGNEDVNIGHFINSYQFHGLLDEIAIFDRALTHQKILAHYKNAKAGNELDNPDEVAPDITLLGDNPQVIAVDSAYVELNATAEDDIDGNITAEIVIDASEVNTSKIGHYEVTYNVSDAAENRAIEVRRDVNVTDATPPTITLSGDATVDVEVGYSYSDAGATANDNIDGNITATIVTVNPVDTNTVGVYTVTYNVTDSAGNHAVEVTRTVNVTSDTTPPTITLSGDATVNVEVGDSYSDAGATANDTIDGDITATIVTVNPVDTNTVGVYTVTYNVTDSAGNHAVEVTRTVTVVEANGSTGGSTLYTHTSSQGVEHYTMSEGNATIELNATLGSFTIATSGKSVTFTVGCIYITVMPDGSVVTGYTAGCSATSGTTMSAHFAAGSHIRVVPDGTGMMIVLDVALDDDLIFGGQ